MINIKERLNALKEELIYEADSGYFYWLIKKPGRFDIAGSSNIKGYRYITHMGIKYSCARIAWYFMTGELPTTLIGYKDGNPNNLRWNNLIPVSKKEMLYNFTTMARDLKPPKVIGITTIQRARFSEEQIKLAVEDFLIDRHFNSQTITK